jgi:hypothetical protein
VFPVELFVAVDEPPVALDELVAVPPVDVSIGDIDMVLVLEFELLLLLCEVAFDLLLLEEPLDEVFWLDVFCVEFCEFVCDWFWELFWFCV